MQQEVPSTFEEVVQYGVQPSKYSFNINYYETGQLIGKGGFSKVYKVRKFKGCGEQFLGKVVILKQLAPKTNQIAEVVNSMLKYQNQIKILKILNGEYSKRFPQCLSYWKTTSTKLYYVVFEGCNYGSLFDLAQYLKFKNKKFTQLQIIFFLREILMGISIMQKLKMMHRDLKLDNIMMDQDFNIKLIDFGLTKVAQNNQNLPIDNRSNGSLFYMCPQILSEEGNYSYEADTWAIGIILYYLMFLKYPFQSNPNTSIRDQKQELLDQIKKFDLEQLKIPFDCFKEFLSLFLQKDKNKRIKEVKSLLKHKLFDRLKDHEDIAKVIQKKYQSYFKEKNPQFNWKKDVQNFNLILPEQITKSPLTLAKAIKFTEGRAIKSIKVKIIDLVWNKDYGVFMLLSNLSLIGYFNNCKIIKFNQTSKTAKRSNQQKILDYMHLKYFKALMLSMREFDNELQFKQPQCTIKKLARVNDKLFVRLSNQVLQVFFQPLVWEQCTLFKVSLQYNTNRVRPKQIIICHHHQQKTRQPNTEVQSEQQLAKYLQRGQLVFQDYNSVTKTQYNKYAQNVKQVLELMIDNLPISFQKMNLSRTNQ